MPSVFSRMRDSLLLASVLLGLTVAPALAQVAPPAPTSLPMRDVLTLEATVTTEVIPDLAVMTLAAEASGPDAAAVTREVQQAVNAALAQARGVRDIEARTGSFSTQPRWNVKGARDGWTVRAELILKSRDFGALGQLAGRLAQHRLMIVGTGFEISHALREREEAALIERGIAAFKAKAQMAARAFGFTGFALREVNLGTSGGAPRPPLRPILARAADIAAASTEPVAIETGPIMLSLTVGGTVQLSR